MTVQHRLALGQVDLSEGELRAFEVGERNILLARVRGCYKALDDVCNHAGCLLSGGHVEDNLVVCPCHEVGFDLDTGRNVTDPDMCDDQPSFRVEVQDGIVSVIVEE